MAGRAANSLRQGTVWVRPAKGTAMDTAPFSSLRFRFKACIPHLPNSAVRRLTIGYQRGTNPSPQQSGHELAERECRLHPPIPWAGVPESHPVTALGGEAETALFAGSGFAHRDEAVIEDEAWELAAQAGRIVVRKVLQEPQGHHVGQ